MKTNKTNYQYIAETCWNKTSLFNYTFWGIWQIVSTYIYICLYYLYVVVKKEVINQVPLDTDD